MPPLARALVFAACLPLVAAYSCATFVSGYQVWDPQVVGTGHLNGTAANAWPQQGTDNTACLIVDEGGRPTMIASFTTMGSNDYGTVNVPLGSLLAIPPHPASNYAQNLTGKTRLNLEYSASSDMWLELRSGAIPHGGDHNQYVFPRTTPIGLVVNVSVPLSAFGGSTRETVDQFLADAYSLTFAALGSINSTNTIKVRAVALV